MAKTNKFTNAWLSSVSAPTLSREEYKDSDCPGLVLRVTSNGIKTFSFPFRLGARTGRLSIGRYPQITLKNAREIVTQAKSEIINNVDPRNKKRADRKALDNTLQILLDQFIEKYSKKKNKSWRQAEYNLRLYLLKPLGDRPVTQINRADILSIIDNLTSLGKLTTANRALAHIKRFFGWLIERGYIDYSPAVYIKPLHTEKPRERVLSDEEIKVIWESLDQLNDSYRNCIKLLFYCGQRLSETAHLRSSQIEDDIWHLTSEDTKNKTPSLVPLSLQALELINKTHQKDKDYIFTSGRIGDLPINGFSKSKNNINKHSKITDWKLHDIRRTVATNLSKMGYDRLLIKRILNHVDRDVTAIYDRYQYINEKKDALQQWAEKLDKIVR